MKEEDLQGIILSAFFEYTGETRAKMLELVRGEYEKRGKIEKYHEIIGLLDKAKDIDQKEKQTVEYSSVPVLMTDEKNKPLRNIENFLKILLEDRHFSDVKFNSHASRPEVHSLKDVRRWIDSDDADARRYIETEYFLHSKDKYEDAMRIFLKKRSFHPIIDKIKKIEWDGENRIETFLHKWMKVADAPYSREVSRLIFAGGINRIMEPGCKFDDVPVLIGKSQGEGKSTFVRWLAMKDDWFSEVTDFVGQEASEALDGAWICELGELLALTRAKEQEAVKSFITRQNDRRRLPYDRRVSDHPRQCIFIGTTNKEQFLTDKTGNRRFYPVVCNQVGYDLFGHKAEIKADIEQCWAEAYHRYMRGEMPAFANRELKAEIAENQRAATEEDYRDELLKDFLSDKTECCILQIWKEAFGNEFSKPNRRESADISLMLQSLEGWERGDKSIRFSAYGVQKVWTKTDEKTLDEDCPF